VPKSGQIFNAVFFVVLLSALTQGWSLPLVARWLQIGRPADPTPALSVEINALRQVDGEILDYTVKARTHVAGQRLRDLALPDGVVVSLILRGREVVMPRGTSLGSLNGIQLQRPRQQSAFNCASTCVRIGRDSWVPLSPDPHH
jgi:cell volume regulation protein A